MTLLVLQFMVTVNNFFIYDGVSAVYKHNFLKEACVWLLGIEELEALKLSPSHHSAWSAAIYWQEESSEFILLTLGIKRKIYLHLNLQMIPWSNWWKTKIHFLGWHHKIQRHLKFSWKSQCKNQVSNTDIWYSSSSSTEETRLCGGSNSSVWTEISPHLIKWILMTFDADLLGSQRINPNLFESSEFVCSTTMKSVFVARHQMFHCHDPGSD